MGWASWNFTGSSLNWTEVAGAASKTAGSWSSAVGHAADEASQTAHDWLTTSPPPGEEQEPCLKATAKALKEMFACNAKFPDHYQNQHHLRCYCLFDLRRTLEDANCERVSHDSTVDQTSVSGIYGQVTVAHGTSTAEQCRPYYNDWLRDHPRPSLLQLLWDWVSRSCHEYPGVARALCVLFLVLLVFLVFWCLSKTRFCRRLVANLHKPFTEGTEVLDEAGSDDGDQPLERAVDKEQVTMVDDRLSEVSWQGMASSRVFRGGTKGKVTRALKVYPDESETEDEDGDNEWQGWGNYIQQMTGLFGPTEEPSHYDMVLEGPTLAELRQQRLGVGQADPPGFGLDERERYRRAGGARPEVLQQAAMRSAPAHTRPPAPTSTAAPFPSRVRPDLVV
mmetsp:Transcript_144976/g.450073  ORF Transcript_144976/g.450073 Transcript_144976/m.450073 type:complete len:393 (+) Transcript_144976:49-1227(+)